MGRRKKSAKRILYEPTAARARRLRQEMTYPEKKLWRSLCNRALAGLKFRRQPPIGPYFADFLCEERKLVIEVDGESHEGHRLYDIHREQFLKNQGYKVLRFENDDVLYDLNAVLDAIIRAARQFRGAGTE